MSAAAFSLRRAKSKDERLYILELAWTKDKQALRGVIQGVEGQYRFDLDKTLKCTCGDFKWKKKGYCKHLLHVAAKLWDQQEFDYATFQQFIASWPAPLKTLRPLAKQRCDADEQTKSTSGGSAVPRLSPECPVCFDEYDAKRDSMVYCATACGVVVHQDCAVKHEAAQAEKIKSGDLQKKFCCFARCKPYCMKPYHPSSTASAASASSSAAGAVSSAASVSPFIAALKHGPKSTYSSEKMTKMCLELVKAHTSAAGSSKPTAATNTAATNTAATNTASAMAASSSVAAAMTEKQLHETFEALRKRWLEKKERTQTELDLLVWPLVKEQGTVRLKGAQWDETKGQSMVDKHVSENVRIAGFQPQTWIRLWLETEHSRVIKNEASRLSEAGLSFDDAVNTALYFCLSSPEIVGL